jgi:hypothetical protein
VLQVSQRRSKYDSVHDYSKNPCRSDCSFPDRGPRNSAERIDTEKNGHHYQGGPKTEVPHHMSKKETVGVATKTQGTGGHHYRGGPATSTPHHMGDKEQ